MNEELIIRLLHQLNKTMIEVLKLQKFIAGELIKKSEEIGK